MCGRGGVLSGFRARQVVPGQSPSAVSARQAASTEPATSHSSMPLAMDRRAVAEQVQQLRRDAAAADCPALWTPVRPLGLTR
jgi:hypothetical protein